MTEGVFEGNASTIPQRQVFVMVIDGDAQQSKAAGRICIGNTRFLPWKKKQRRYKGLWRKKANGHLLSWSLSSIYRINRILPF